MASRLLRRQLAAVVRAMPPVDAACAYGSAVIPQANANRRQGKPPLADMLIAVRDPVSWHREWAQRLRRQSDNVFDTAAMDSESRLSFSLNSSDNSSSSSPANSLSNSSPGASPHSDRCSFVAHPIGLHYSTVGRMLFSQAHLTRAARWLQHSGAGVWYNTDAQFDVVDASREAGTAAAAEPAETLRIKYGVISTIDLVQDLTEWTTLYCAGRLHKPVLWLSRDERVDRACELNFDSALSYGLYQLTRRAHDHVSDPRQGFPFDLLLEYIVGLSYQGDPRMGIAENPDKVRNIIAGGGAALREIYIPIIERDFGRYVSIDETGERINFSCSLVDADFTRALIAGLPERMSSVALSRMSAVPFNEKDIAAIVAKPSRTQTFKGIISANPLVALNYVLAKFQRARGR